MSLGQREVKMCKGFIKYYKFWFLGHRHVRYLNQIGRLHRYFMLFFNVSCLSPKIRCSLGQFRRGTPVAYFCCTNMFECELYRLYRMKFIKAICYLQYGNEPSLRFQMTFQTTFWQYFNPNLRRVLPCYMYSCQFKNRQLINQQRTVLFSNKWAWHYQGIHKSANFRAIKDYNS